MIKFGALCIAVLGMASSAGCGDRSHLTESYGRAHREAFARQVADPGAGERAKAPKGLDAQEASIVVDTYRKQLAPKGAASDEHQPILLLTPQSGASQGYVPPPSVPQGH